MDEQAPAFISFAEWYLRQAAILIGAAEAGFFLILGNDWNRRFDCLVHLRNDPATPAVKEQARQAFIDLLAPCVKAGKNGVLETAPAVQNRLSETRGPQYCLVVLIRGLDTVPVAVATFIVRCADIEEARDKMRIVALHSPSRGG